MKRLISRLLCLGAALYFALAARQVSAAVPTITTQPVGGAVPCGSNFTLSVTATGLSPLAYQWRQNLAPLADATNSSFSLIASVATAGDYTVVVSDADGSVTSAVATVTVVDTNPPVINCPADLIAAEFPHDGGSAVVEFAAPVASDACDNSPIVACVPPSGTAFAIGYTSVSCEARDVSGNSDKCAFVIRVIPYRLRVTTTADAGPSSLRQALLDANDAPGENLVVFQLPGAGPFVIGLASALPVVTSPVILDGWSQAGFIGTPMIELNGAGAAGVDGLVIQSASNVVRGLALHGFSTAVRLESGSGNVLQSNYFGTDATGMHAPGNLADGLFVGSPANLVRDNLICGNGNAGLQIAGADAVENVVQGNLIGVAADNRSPLGNVLDGILICSNAARNVIGGTSGRACNVIAFNRRNGIGLNADAGAGNALRANAIYSNEQLGIDLALDGPTANDAADADTGPNGLQNFPVLADARSADGVTTIDGSLESASGVEYRLDFYLNDQTDPSGYGEGARNIGSTIVTLRNGTGQDFSASFPVPATFLQFITATATDPWGSTSEFSPPVQVRTPPVLDTQPAAIIGQTGEPATLCVGASGTPPLYYQWRLNGQNIVGATNPCFTIPALESTNGGAFSVVVVNGLGAKQTVQATLTLSLTNLAGGDFFADRVLIEGTNGLIVWRNRFASREPDEPDHAGKPGGKSVWYKWIAPVTGVATVGTRGSTFDTLLAVYEGTALTNLEAVGFDEDRGGFFTSGARFNAIKDREYQIAIDGFGGAEGEFVFGWSHEDSVKMLPIIRAQPQDQILGPGANALFSVEAVRFCGQGHPGCPDPEHFPEEELPLLTYQWTFNGAPIPDATLASLTISNVQPEHVGIYTVLVSTRYRSIESVEVSLQINETEQQVQPVLAVDKFRDAELSLVQLRLGNRGGGAFIGAGGGIQPAAVVRGYTGTSIFSTRRSTTEPDELICGVLGGASEWIPYVCEESGRFYLNTDGSSFDTVIAIFRRDPNTLALQLLACDNDSGTGRASSTDVPVEVGVTNFILVDGVDATFGTVRLNYTLVTPSRLDSLGFTTERAHILQVSTHAGARFSIQTSANLTNWTTILTTNAPLSLLDFIDEGSIREPRRFYRALMLP